MNNEGAKENLMYIEDTGIKSSSVIKRLIRKLTYWLYRPMFDQQVEYNRQLLSIIEELRSTQSCLVENIQNLNNERQMYIDAFGSLEDRRRDKERIFESIDNLNRNVNDLNRNVSELRSVNCYLPKNGKPRVIQLVSCLNFGDAVGNEVVAFKKFLSENGYVTEIFTESMSNKLPADTAVNYRRMPVLDKDDIVIYHFASQCALYDVVKQLKCKVVLRYHNVTPPAFFDGYDENAVRACSNGLSQVAELREYIDCCLPVSEFNKQDLINMGYTCPMTVLPILIRFSDYEQTPDSKVIERYKDGRTNILFVGRMAPNKKVEDVITAFAVYKEKYDKTARLFLVGSYGEGDGYYRKLVKHISDLGVEDVIFPGHISFAGILAYYSVADVFLCMSEHEGFCVPLVEAMYFHVPIVAYSSSAIPSTLGGSGVLIEDKDFDKFADAINNIVEGKNRIKLITSQDKRLEDFSQKNITAQLKSFVESIM
ncbi:MAG: glycosyltransferase family 4 protein [Ruminococcus sp.]|nr:glycosyltransferase family 4 protein [Ruminococcus sp.]